jgi:uncharacterized protein
VTLLGGGLGAVLLVVTPPGEFTKVVPFLVVAGAFALIAAPWLQKRQTATRHHPATLAGWLLALAIYSGYFGAGSGVMTLALLLVTVDRRMPTANALKNMLIGAAVIPAAVVVTFLAPVHWPDAAVLAAGTLVGSRLGPSVTRRVPAAALRWVVVALGIGLAVQLWVNPPA